MDDAKDDAPQKQPQAPTIDLTQAHEAPVALTASETPATFPDELMNPLTLTAAPDAVGGAQALNHAVLAAEASVHSSANAPDALFLPTTPTRPATFGPYILLRRLGGGALGEVYLAAMYSAETTKITKTTDTTLAQSAQSTESTTPTPRALNAPVAIKLFYAPADDPATQEVIRRTTQAASLAQRHSIPLYELITTQNRLGVVMGFAPRGSLGDALNRRDGSRLVAPLGARVVARLVGQLADALAALHAGGLAHGDLTPDNIFVHRGPDGAPTVALADMGQGALAPEVAHALAQQAPQTDELRAWAALQRHFAAPERATDGATPAGDQYALATLAYLLLTGHAPDTTPRDQPPLAPEIATIIERALSQIPDARYPTIEAFARALTAALDPTLHAEPVATAAETEAPPSAIRPPTRIAPLPATPMPPASLRRPLILATAMALIIALCIVSVGIYAFSGIGVYHPPASITLGNTGDPTATPTPTLTPAERIASASAATLRQQTPVFSDPLDGGAKHWATGGGVTYGANGSLHLASANVVPLTDDDPSHTQQSDPLVQVTLSFVKGNASSLAGMRFFVTQNSDKTSSYMAYLIAPYGRYSLWLNQSGVWTMLISGYTTALNKGIGKTNGIAALADGTDGVITLFANGRLIAQVYLPNDYNGPTGGTLGLIVLSKSVEVAYTRYAVYAGPAPTATTTP